MCLYSLTRQNGHHRRRYPICRQIWMSRRWRLSSSCFLSFLLGFFTHCQPKSGSGSITIMVTRQQHVGLGHYGEKNGCFVLVLSSSNNLECWTGKSYMYVVWSNERWHWLLGCNRWPQHMYLFLSTFIIPHIVLLR